MFCCICTLTSITHEGGLAMGAGRYVGRVGGLAAALGVGLGISLSVPVAAWADDASTGASSAPSEHTAPSGRGKQAKRTQKSLPVDSAGAPKSDTQSSRLSGLPSHSRPAAASPNTHAAIESTTKRKPMGVTAPPRSVVSTLKPTPQAAVGRVSAAAVATPTAPHATVTLTAVAASAPASAPTESVAVSAAASVSRALLGVLPGGSPVAAPLSWVVAAVSRRELGLASVAAVPVAGAPVSNTAPKITSTTVSNPNSSTGIVTGAVKATDAQKDSLTYSASASAKGGVVAIDPVTGKFTYTPTAAARHDAATTGAATAAKTDTFTVTVTDTAGEAATKLVTVKVSPTNATPVKAGPSAGSADTATGVVIGNVGVTDADSDALTYTATPKKGTVSFGPDGSFTYTASAKAMHAASALKAKASDKSETFTVTIKDGHGATVTQVVTVQIAPANVAPTAVSSPVVTKENSSTGAVTGKVSAADGDMDKLTYSGAAAKGKVSVSSSGTFTYTPTSAARHAASADGATDADKTDTVTITANDGHGGLLIQTIDVDIAGKNAKPGSVSTKIGKANADTGVITGTVKATDADKDSLTYSVTPASAKGGSVRIDAATGAFVYTPTAAARNAAAAKNAPKVAKTDTFTVTIADGHGDSVNKVVTVTVSPKASTTQQGGLSVVGSVAIEGKTYNAVFSHDGTRAVVTAVTGDDATGYTTSLTVIDPTTATKRGSAITVSGFLSTVQYSADGTRALVTTTDSVSDATTRLVTINTTTGAQVGTTVVVGGTTSAGVTFSSNGSRAFLVTSASTDNGGSIGSTTRIAVVNTATGVQAGNTVTFSNDYASYNQDGDMIATPNSLQWTSNGTRAVLSTSGYNEDTEDGEIKVAVVDTVNGTVLGGVQTFSGVLYSDVQLSVDSTRAAVAINSLDGSSAATVKLVNLVTGAVSATQITQSGIIAAAQFTPDSTRLVVNTTAYGAEPSTFTTYIGVYNAASGAQIAAPVTMSGVSVAPASFNASGTRAVVTVDTFNSAATSPADQISSVGVVVINTATGAKVGSIVTVPGSPLLESRISAVPWVPVQVNADGSRALITTVSGDDTHGYTTRIALVDTATGAKVGSTVTAVGTTRIGLDMHLPAFSADGTRAVVTTFVGDETSGYTTHIAVLNTVTGAQLGGVVTLAGGIADNNFSLVQFNTDGTRAVIATNAGDWDTGFTGQVALLNTATGGQLGALKNYADDSPIVAMFSGDGTRLYVNGESYADMSGASTYFAVFDAATGNQIGSTLSYIGTQSAIMVTNADTDRKAHV